MTLEYIYIKGLGLEDEASRGKRRTGWVGGVAVGQAEWIRAGFGEELQVGQTEMDVRVGDGRGRGECLEPSARAGVG